MEITLILALAALALLIWKSIEISDKTEQIDARLNNIDTVLAAYYKMLKELQPKGEVEIPKRLSVEQLKTIFKDEFLFPEPNEALKKGAGEYKKKTLTTNEQNVLKELYGDKNDNQYGVYDKDDIEEMKVWDATLMDGMDDNHYGNEGDTFSLYEDEQLKKIRKHVQERKKQSLNK